MCMCCQWDNTSVSLLIYVYLCVHVCVCVCVCLLVFVHVYDKKIGLLFLGYFPAASAAVATARVLERGRGRLGECCRRGWRGDATERGAVRLLWCKLSYVCVCVCVCMYKTGSGYVSLLSLVVCQHLLLSLQIGVSTPLRVFPMVHKTWCVCF